MVDSMISKERYYSVKENKIMRFTHALYTQCMLATSKEIVSIDVMR